MPIRQPNSGRSPRASACSSSVAPELLGLLAGARRTGCVPSAPSTGPQRGGLEVLHPQPRVVGERLLDQLDEPGRAAGPGVDVGVLRRASGPARRWCSAGSPALGVEQVDVDVGRQVGQLVGVDLVVGRLGVVHEVDGAAVPAAQQRAQDRHHRGDAGAAGDQQQPAGQRVGQGELAVGLREVDDVADPGVVDQVLGHHAVGVGAHGERDEVAGLGLRRGDREAAGTAGAVDLDADLDVLAGLVAAPGAGRLEGDRGDRLAGAGLAGDVDDAGAHLVDDPHGVDELEVAVHAVGRRERADQGDRRRVWVEIHGAPPFQ